MTEILIPEQPYGAGTSFLEFLPATQDDYATVSVAARVALDRNSAVADALDPLLRRRSVRPAELDGGATMVAMAKEKWNKLPSSRAEIEQR